MKNCKCGNFFSYQENLNKKRDSTKLVSKSFCALMPKDDCYNCYLIKHYGTSDPKKVKKISKERAIKRFHYRKLIRDKEERK